MIDDSVPWLGECLRKLRRHEESLYIGIAHAADESEIVHDRECPECGATTYQFERCHECGDVHWRGSA